MSKFINELGAVLFKTELIRKLFYLYTETHESGVNVRGYFGQLLLKLLHLQHIFVSFLPSTLLPILIGGLFRWLWSGKVLQQVITDLFDCG